MQKHCYSPDMMAPCTRSRPLDVCVQVSVFRYLGINVPTLGCGREEACSPCIDTQWFPCIEFQLFVSPQSLNTHKTFTRAIYDASFETVRCCPTGAAWDVANARYAGVYPWSEQKLAQLHFKWLARRGQTAKERCGRSLRVHRKHSSAGDDV